ncbi:MAG: TonB-dependent receptor [Breznakibacter sp.]
MNIKTLYFYLILIQMGIFLPSLHAANVKGKITDKETGEELVGCTVFFYELKLGTTTGFDGTYELKNVPVGKHTLQISFISYENVTQPVLVDAQTQTLQLDIVLTPSTASLNEVVVVSQLEKNSDASARSSERNSNQVINVVSAKTIELSPDLNVASVLGRMSGVTMEKNSSGEGQYAILRGMDKRYNYTLVNGVKIPSPDNKHRYVPLDIFPSELLDRVEVTKSLTASMEGDAAGGVVNMVMKDAPSHFLFQANAALGYNSWLLDHDLVTYAVSSIQNESPRERYGKDYKASMGDFNTRSGKLAERSLLPNGTAGLSIGNRFKDDKLGLVLAANYQQAHKGASSDFFEDEMLQTEQSIRLTAHNKRTYSETQTQYGIHAKADYRLPRTGKIEWYNVFIGTQNAQVRQTTSTNFKLNYDPANGDLDLAYQTRIRTQNQQLFASMWQGKHYIGTRLLLDWSAVYSVATNRLPENTQINLDQLLQNHEGNIFVDADGSTRRWEHNTDRDYTAIANLKRRSEVGSTKLDLKAGALYRDKKRSNSYVNYRFKPDGDQRMGIEFNTLDEIQWTVYTPSGSVGPLEYDATEKIAAGYVNASLSGKNWTANVGIRGEHTDQGYYMYFPNAGESPDASQTYLDLLPSVQLKYSPREQINWKVSYFKSINRPGFYEIVPYQIINEEYMEYGNPDLQRAQIDNIDLRWEFFPASNEQLMVGLFYKNIQNPIEYAYFTKNYRQYGYGPVNLGDAQNYGAEIDLTKFVRNWGVRANYTYTHSTITSSKAYYGTDENGSYKRFFKDQTRPLVGQAGHVANLSLMYKNTRHGWDAQLATSYTGEKIDIASHYLDSDYWQGAMFQIDASAEKKFGQRVSAFVKANNLYSSPRKLYVKTTNDYNLKFSMQNNADGQTLIRKDRYGSTFLIGVRVKL